jgi:hypothetical protein
MTAHAVLIPATCDVRRTRCINKSCNELGSQQNKSNTRPKAREKDNLEPAVGAQCEQFSAQARIEDQLAPCPTTRTGREESVLICGVPGSGILTIRIDVQEQA